uniref:Carboxylesterase type B domain-containing protein n=1 Tax=Daphnia galeata TaxID=27404 RepID=A0A8J2RQZ0_9CRUS|nr:unnamed protein product [Daphnia galeata]
MSKIGIIFGNVAPHFSNGILICILQREDQHFHLSRPHDQQQQQRHPNGFDCCRLSQIVVTFHRGLDHFQCCPNVIRASTSAASIMSVAPTADNAQSSGRIVKTKYGNLRGFTLPHQQQPGSNSHRSKSSSTAGGPAFNNNNVEAFLGIPYAAAPIGSLRYLPPASPGPWGPSIRPANILPPACPQQMPPLANRSASLEWMPRARYYQLKRMQLMLANQSEDCLFLNIYAPSEGFSSSSLGSPTTPFSTSLAVVVLIHGESYSWGAGHLIDGGMLANKSRMVVVTLNYRLGILGFLQTAASPTPGQTRGKSKHAIPTQGNYGLLDIMAALVWLKDNIGSFGGDSNRITLSGHGTGAALVNLLMISPLAAGLFHRAILMSGSALSPWALNHQAGWLKAEVARQMDCDQHQSNKEMNLMMADIGDCLRKRPLDSLMNVRLPPTPRFCTSFAPFVDGAGIVAVDPLQAMQSASQDFVRIPLVAGVTSIESYRHIGDKDLREGMSEDRRDRSLRTLIRNFYQFHLNEIYYVLRNEYTDWDRPSALDALSMRDSLSLALSDALVVAPLMHVVHLHAQRSANPSGTFFYHYQGQQQQQQQQQTIMTQPPTINVGQQQNNDADLSEYNRLGSVTGEELESLELDATANGAPWYNSDDDQHEDAPYISNNNSNNNSSNVIHHNEAMSGSQFLPFLTAFASTGDPNLEIGSKGELIPRSKLRWEPFNLHSQYYMTHYRGHHIAVWLQLIPQLHQPGGEPPGAYATSSSYSNHHRFDQKNTPVEQFYEGVVRQQFTHLLGTGNATMGWPSIGSGPTATNGAVECSSSGNVQRNANNLTQQQQLNSTSSSGKDRQRDWTLVNPNVMASETGSNNNNNTLTGTTTSHGGGGGTMLGFFLTNETALCITLVLGIFFLAANLILFAAIYRRRVACGRRRNVNKQNNEQEDEGGGDTNLQRMSDVSRLEGRVATESIESMTDLRQMVANSSGHCLQHSSRDNHPDITSAVIQHPPPQQYSDLTSKAVRMSPPSPPYLLKAPPPHHQFLLDESNRRTSSTLPGNRRSAGQQLTSTNHHQATTKSIREITV